MKIQKSTVSFKFEGLEPRIMLSAVPMDGGVDFVEEPLISESIALLEQESLEANSFTTDSLDAVSYTHRRADGNRDDRARPRGL